MFPETCQKGGLPKTWGTVKLGSFYLRGSVLDGVLSDDARLAGGVQRWSVGMLLFYKENVVDIFRMGVKLQLL